MRSLIVLALMSLALACGASAADDEASRQLLEKLCRHEKPAPVVTKVDEVKSLINLLKQEPSVVECDAKVAAAIKALEPVVELKNVCSEAAVDTLVSFWEAHIRTRAFARKHLPGPLRKFFIAFGLQASKLCKTAMIEQLAKATSQSQIDDDDIKFVTESIQQNIDKLFNGKARLENLFIVIPAVAKDEKKGAINMQPLQKKIFENARERCVTKFKPVYNTLIKPVVRLAAIGVNYKSKSMNARVESFQEDELYKNWFAAVLACESISKFNPVTVPKATQDADGNDKLITVLDDDDMDELKKRGISLEGPSTEPVADYTVEAPVDDLVLNVDDTDLVRCLKGYSKIMKDMNTFRLRMLKKFPYLLKTYADVKSVQWGMNPTKVRKYGKYGKIRSRRFNWMMFMVFALLMGGAIAATVLAVAATPGGTLFVFFTLACLVMIAIFFSGAFVSFLMAVGSPVANPVANPVPKPSE